MNHLTLTVKTPEGAKIRVFAVENADVPKMEKEIEIFSVSAENGETKFSLAPDRYVIRQEKAGYYSAERCLDLTEDTTLSLALQKRYGYGYEPHEERMIYTYEGWDKFAPDSDERWKPYEVIFDTPAFTVCEGEEGAHRIPTNRELWDFVREEDAKNPNMRLFTLFESAVYNLPAPIAVFAKNMPEGELTMEELGEALQANGKPTVHYQAQIHGNETSGCAAAMGLMKYLNTPAGEKLLDGINLYIIPRLNPEGALLYKRQGGQELDLNRDFFPMYARETRGSYRAFRAFMPCLVIDAHELRTRKLSRVMRYEDIQLSGGCAPNGDPERVDNNLNLMFAATDEIRKMGLRSYFYLDHISGVSMSTGTRYFFERGAMTVLVECRGIDLGFGRYHRRIMGQFTAVRRILEELAADPEKYSAPIKRDRERFMNTEGDFVVSGAYTDDPENDPKFPIYEFDVQTGELLKTENKPVTIYKNVAQSRPRPRRYVLPLGKPWEKELTAFLDRHLIQYEIRSQARSLSLSRFVREGEKIVLSEPRLTEFPEGVLTVPVAQEANRFISFVFEADCPDSKEAKESLIFEKHLKELFFPEGDFDVYR